MYKTQKDSNHWAAMLVEQQALRPLSQSFPTFRRSILERQLTARSASWLLWAMYETGLHHGQLIIQTTGRSVFSPFTQTSNLLKLFKPSPNGVTSEWIFMEIRSEVLLNCSD